MMNRKLWLPLVTWVTGVIFVTYLLSFFYNPSPTITASYIVILLAGFYILWKGKEISEVGKKIQKRVKTKAAAKLGKKGKK